ncbi:Bro-N domain-containing protein [Streptomyces sp. LBUM 1478]|nr:MULTISPECIES: Bro-N domain-containing protein [Streptomyces]MBP5868507.1 Bro-N domain-containing protein [Streptomyces sp. LBUM 1485]MBP5907071.1 Bro-N domain-containing protein [Streptomyces sp. LBUM 1478]MBP5930098.1 Bro-N domain-containing protein [Streptomyces sp. LBUM 1479]MBP5915568.1 Bro-N domain-containing protein [Streptomyces sp. LBUM 1486]MDX2575055.1 Bro-N domain-containing protein [Streptomyces scabiei]
MIEPSRHQPEPGPRHEAIDISDFVYAATGARVRRLTMPDGAHWFPAVDVCKELGHTSPSKAVSDHVPLEHRAALETVSRTYGLSIPAGRGWRRDLILIDMQGLLFLVTACTKPTAAPFKQWAVEVIETVQREGSYTLEEAEVQPSEPGAPIAYAMPEQVAEAIVRLEERNLQADEQLTVAQHRSIALQEQMVELQTAALAAQQVMAQAMERIADRLDALTLARPVSDTTTVPKQPTTETVLADWRERLSVTEDVWTVAVVIAPVLVEKGELRQPLEAIAGRTGLSVHRVNECLRLLRKHACIHPRGAAEDGTPVYVLNRR